MYQRAIILNQRHPGSHIALAQAMWAQQRKSLALLVTLRFLFLEPKGARAGLALQLCQHIMRSGVERQSAREINITREPRDTSNNMAEDDFRVVDLALSLAAAWDLGQDKGDKSEAERFLDQLRTFGNVLEEQRPRGQGFFWERLAPYLTGC